MIQIPEPSPILTQIRMIYQRSPPAKIENFLMSNFELLEPAK